MADDPTTRPEPPQEPARDRDREEPVALLEPGSSETSETVVYCSQCGDSMAVDQRFCTSCGWDADNPEQPPPSGAGQRTPPPSPRELGPPSQKNRLTALLLCVILGWAGAHRFYVGRNGTAVLWLLTVGLLGVGIVFDLVTIATGEFKDDQEKRLLYWE